MKALLIIFIILSVFLLLPIGIDGGYDGSAFHLYVRLGIINIKLFPRMKKAHKPKKPKPQKVKKDKKKKPPMTKDDVFALIKMALKSLGHLRRHLSVNYLRLHYTAAADDPFNTAMAYGIGSAFMGTVVPLVEEAFNIKERDFGVSADFLAGKPVFDFRLITSIQIWEVMYIAFAFAMDFLKYKFRQKQKSKQESKRKE